MGEGTAGDEPPTMPSGVLTLTAPPPLPAPSGGGHALLNVFPMVGALTSIGLVVTMGSGDRTRMYLVGAMMLLTTLGFLFVQVDRGRGQRIAAEEDARGDYLHYLAEVRTSIREIAAAQRRALLWHFPAPAALAALVARNGPRSERLADHPYRAHLRFGRTPWPLAVELRPPPGSPVDRTDPVSASALHRLLVTHRSQPDLPALVDLRGYRRIELCGPRQAILATARAMVTHGAAFHAAELLRVGVLCPGTRRSDWEWLVWLPHARSPVQRDAIGGLRLVCSDVTALAKLLGEPADDEHRGLLVLDGVDLPLEQVPVGMTVLDLRETWAELRSRDHLRILLDPPDPDRGEPVVRARAISLEHPEAAVDLDSCEVELAEATARHLWSSSEPTARGSTGARDLGSLLGVGPLGDIASAPERPRPDRARSEHDLLRVPIGVGTSGEPVWLDLKESAQHGMGPHGLVVGATGSGKSEFLRTLVLGLAVSHGSEELNLVLVDFKGGATFAGLADLPHCSAVITNLADEVDLVARMQDALGGELVRRQELLRAAGSLASRRELEQTRATGAAVPAMPLLLVVVDEFSELLAARPEFIDLFVAIGRLGRSLGVHLLLASQRLEEGRLRGLESHLSYRVGLRTFSAAESRSVLGVPDAHDLPNRPGVGYLRSDPSSLVRFTTAYVSGPARPAAPGPAQLADAPVALPLRLDPVGAPVPTTAAPAGAVTGATPGAGGPMAESVPSELEVTVQRLAGSGPPAHRVWLPPLTVPDTIGALAGPLVANSRGLQVSGTDEPLRVAVGTVDRPREQRRDPWLVDLSGAGGHAAVVGAPRAGKSTALRSLVAALTLTHTPAEAQFHLLDFGGGTFAGWRDHPHVAALATRAEPDVVRRVVAHVRSLLSRRAAWFAAHGLESVEDHRALVRRGGGDGQGEVFVVVDGWAVFRAEFEDLEAQLQAVATEGLGYGVHLLLSATRWTDLRAGLRDQVGTRLELKLGDPLDSEIDRRTAAAVPAGRPGRGLTREGEHCLVALPRVDGNSDPATLPDGVADLLARTTAAWTGDPGPKLRLLPTCVERHRLVHATTPEVQDLVLGVRESDLTTVPLDPAAHPHLVVFGDAGSGRTNLLRTLAAEVVRTRSPAQAQLVVVDPRRTLLGEVPASHLAEYVTGTGQAAQVLGEVAALLERRRPGAEVTPAQLRSRAWWQGPEVFVVVDDLDLLTGSAGSPLAALLDLLPQARDVGLHLVVARRAGGASRALYEPVLQALRDLATPGLLLSGSPSEGALVGTTKARPGVPGRAQFVTRDEVQTIQVAWTPPTA